MKDNPFYNTLIINHLAFLGGWACHQYHLQIYYILSNGGVLNIQKFTFRGKGGGRRIKLTLAQNFTPYPLISSVISQITRSYVEK